MTDESADIVVECDLEEPPAKVWRALTEPELRDAWLTDGEPEIACEELEREEGRSVRYAWRDGGRPSEVAFEIAETEGGGTRLRIAHSLVAAPVLMAFPRRIRRQPAAALRRTNTMTMRWAA